MKKNFSLESSWSSLGITFLDKPNKNSDPEMTLFLSAREALEDRKLFFLILSWMENFHEYIHVERLQSILKNDFKTTKDVRAVIFIGGLALHCEKTLSDKRWNLISRTCKTLYEAVGSPVFEVDPGDEYHLKQQGSIANFEIFGLKIPKQNEKNLSSSKKKIADLSTAIKSNQWFFFRSLVGPTFRADVLYALHQGASNPTEVMKIALCSYETAHRLFDSFKRASVFENLRLLDSSQTKAS